jgi:hypothetical protein
MNNKSQREQQTATATSCLVAATQHGGLAEEGETKLAIYVEQSGAWTGSGLDKAYFFWLGMEERERKERRAVTIRVG